MALIKLRTWCPKCGSAIPVTEKDKHECYTIKNQKSDNIHLKPTHLVHAKKAGDFCSCGGNEGCRRCGGTGRIS